MRSGLMYALVLGPLLIGSLSQSAGQVRQKAAGLPLEKLELHNVKVEPATYLGEARCGLQMPARRVLMMQGAWQSFREAPFRMAPLK